MEEFQSGSTDECPSGGYARTYVYPGVGEYKVEISVFMLPLTAPQLVTESHNGFGAFHT
jgi:hypothetical protein